MSDLRRSWRVSGGPDRGALDAPAITGSAAEDLTVTRRALLSSSGLGGHRCGTAPDGGELGGELGPLDGFHPLHDLGQLVQAGPVHLEQVGGAQPGGLEETPHLAVEELQGLLGDGGQAGAVAAAEVEVDVAGEQPDAD